MEYIPYLDNSLPVIGCLGINDDVKLHLTTLHDTLERYKGAG